jgi:hypothetical protein
MIEQSIVHLPELVKDIERPVSIYLVHLSSFWERAGVKNQGVAEAVQLRLGIVGLGDRRERP